MEKHKSVRNITVFALLLGLLLVPLGVTVISTPVQAEDTKSEVKTNGVIVLPDSIGKLPGTHPKSTFTLDGKSLEVHQHTTSIGTLLKSKDSTDSEVLTILKNKGIQAELNYVRTLPELPQQEERPEVADEPDCWHVEKVGAEIAHQNGITGMYADGNRVKVAVIDTGVYPHKDLVSILDTENQMDFAGGDNIADDDYGHGTHVAGIVNRICPDCEILPVKVLSSGSGDDFTIAHGINYAVQKGSEILNLSLGEPRSAILCDAVNRAQEQNALVVVAAGNRASGNEDSIGYPGLCNDEVLLVSAIHLYFKHLNLNLP